MSGVFPPRHPAEAAGRFPDVKLRPGHVGRVPRPVTHGLERTRGLSESCNEFVYVVSIQGGSQV